MSGKIWLVVEDEDDGRIVRQILAKKRISVQIEIRSPIGGSGGISRLAMQLEKTIEELKTLLKTNDCICVLHDFDIRRQQQDRKSYDDIKRICQKEKVKLVIAHDEIEAWLLADSGLCQWLGEPVKNWDEETKPRYKLNSILKAKKGLKYQGRGRDEVLKHLAGNGEVYSPSMKKALEHLENAPCVKS